MNKVARIAVDNKPNIFLDYSYDCKLKIGSRVRVPIKNVVVDGTVIDFPNEKVKFKLKSIISSDDYFSFSEEQVKLAEWLANYYNHSVESVLRSMLPVPPKKISKDLYKSTNFVEYVILKKKLNDDELAKILVKAPKQAEILQNLMEKKECLRSDFSGKSAIINALLKKDLISLKKKKVKEVEILPDKKIELNVEQKHAFEEIIKVKAPHTFLLHGVTGSGKTEVYLQVIDYFIEKGKTAIYIVPEISLTPQTLARVQARFKQKDCAYLHSKLSPKERFLQWQKIYSGEAKIVIGARSAIFAPIKNLALIIIDEEHDGSLKQDSIPRYHARDTAILRSNFEKAIVLLGSATPSLESFYNVKKNKFSLVELKNRVDNRSLPLVRVLDMKREPTEKWKNARIFSLRLQTAISKRVKNNEQVILFLNKRGYRSSLHCYDCDNSKNCPNCSVSLTYHLEKNFLLCHWCGYQEKFTSTCAYCLQDSLVYRGYGTELVEENCRILFPKSRVARLDSDTSQRLDFLEDTLLKFKARKIDILIGTQMIAKGLDFHNVTLVGILNADIGINSPDFRTSERIFQLLMQVSGRAGRGEKLGEVIIQTHSPQLSAIQFARANNYEDFAKDELSFRKQLSYPPYLRLALVSVRSKDKDMAETISKYIFRFIKENFSKYDFFISEAQPAPIEIIASQYRYQCIVRTQKIKNFTICFNHAIKNLNKSDKRKVVITLDIDAYNLL